MVRHKRSRTCVYNCILSSDGISLFLVVLHLSVQCSNLTSYCLPMKGYLTVYFEPPQTPVKIEYIDDRLGQVLQHKADSRATVLDSVPAVIFRGLLHPSFVEAELGPSDSQGNVAERPLSGVVVLIVTSVLAFVGVFLLIKRQTSQRRDNTERGRHKSDVIEEEPGKSQQEANIETPAPTTDPSTTGDGDGGENESNSIKTGKDSCNSSEFSLDLSMYINNDLSIYTNNQSIENNSIVEDTDSRESLDTATSEETCSLQNMPSEQSEGSKTNSYLDTSSFDLPLTPSCTGKNFHWCRG